MFVQGQGLMTRAASSSFEVGYKSENVTVKIMSKREANGAIICEEGLIVEVCKHLMQLLL